MMFMPHYPAGTFGYLFAILGGLSWLAIIAGIVLLVIWAIRSMPRTAYVGPAPTKVETPEDILARRFAKGEITAEEFTRSRDLLRGSPPQP
ncbi:MAG TPA: SHOCT domain-containing protein [Candidatus Acidoferrum sp.]|nr:SHOCT domain-containing protein [Candidatus Acidoferrum sp.]